MHNTTKKIMKAFRLRADLNAKLIKMSAESGLPATEIIEDALRFHFADFRKNMRRKAEALSKWHRLNFKLPPAVAFAA